MRRLLTASRLHLCRIHQLLSMFKTRHGGFSESFLVNQIVLRRGDQIFHIDLSLVLSECIVCLGDEGLRAFVVDEDACAYRVRVAVRHAYRDVSLLLLGLFLPLGDLCRELGRLLSLGNEPFLLH